MNGEVFEAYFEQFVVPKPRDGDIIVLDNLGASLRGGEGPARSFSFCRRTRPTSAS